MECFFLDSRLRGNDKLPSPGGTFGTAVLSRQGRGMCTLHLRPRSGWPISPATGEVCCFVRLKCYQKARLGNLCGSGVVLEEAEERFGPEIGQAAEGKPQMVAVGLTGPHLGFGR